MITVNLPEMLHKALLRSERASLKSMAHAKSLSDKAKVTGSAGDHMAAIRGYNLSMESQSMHAAVVSQIMAGIQAQGSSLNDCDTCDDENCPVHGGEKPN